jgi:hypothetical protein
LSPCFRSILSEFPDVTLEVKSFQRGGNWVDERCDLCGE